MQAFVVNADRKNCKINIQTLYNIKFTKKMRKIYDKVDMYEEADNPDLVDNSGYFGIFYRQKVPLSPITDKELIDIIVRNNKLVAIMKNIKEIDRDNNGYVTNQELDDIFKMHYETELGSKDLKFLFKPFASLQNRILIDYKKLRDHIIAKLRERGIKPDQQIPSTGRQATQEYTNNGMSEGPSKLMMHRKRNTSHQHHSNRSSFARPNLEDPRKSLYESFKVERELSQRP